MGTAAHAVRGGETSSWGRLRLLELPWILGRVPIVLYLGYCLPCSPRVPFWADLQWCPIPAAAEPDSQRNSTNRGMTVCYSVPYGVKRVTDAQACVSSSHTSHGCPSGSSHSGGEKAVRGRAEILSCAGSVAHQPGHQGPLAPCWLTGSLFGKGFRGARLATRSWLHLHNPP